MKKNIILFLLSLTICSSEISAGTLIDLSDQSVTNFSDSLKNKISVPKDTSVQRIKKEVLLPVKYRSLLGVHLIDPVLSKGTLETIDYRTTADYFTNVPFGFIKDFGSVGMPNETFIYGSANISFMSDGVVISDRLNNSLDLNLFESESVDSAELIPLSRGFLYSGVNNSASVNFISRDPDSRKSYSRLRYYQAANSEALLDGIFSFNPLSRVNAYIEISNQNTSPNFINTDFSNWSGTGRIRYLLSKRVNITASYRYSKSVAGLNGGVNADSIMQAYGSSQFESVLYDNLRAPVRYVYRYQKSTINDFRLRLLGDFLENSFTDLALYYQSSLNEFRQNELSESDESKIKKIISDNSAKTLGANLRQDIKFDFGEITSLTNLEKSTYNSPLLAGETLKSSFSQSVSASLGLFGNTIRPSLFGKYLNYSDKSYLGFGADLSLNLLPSIDLYAGVSSYEKPYSVWEERLATPSINPGNQRISSVEMTLVFGKKSYNASLGYFYKSNTNALLSTTYTGIAAEEMTQFFAARDIVLNGLNLRIDFKLWKILLSSNSSFYFPSGNRKDYKLPDYTSSGGIYYIDTLFNRNLHLKAGLNYYSTGKRDFIYYDFARSLSSCYNFNPSAPYSDIIAQSLSSTFQVDFFLAGKIQNSATVYFVYENLLNSKYYIIPYYPKQSSAIRFGVAWEFLD